MAKFILSSSAKLDLRNIATYTATTWSRVQADKYYNMLMDACEQIAHNQARGKKYGGVAENLRGLRAGRHIIFYARVEHDDVLIVRILHSQMDLNNRLLR